MAPTEFNAAFIERRMEQHRRWQHQAEHALIEEIIDEAQALPRRQPRPGRLFELLPEHVQLSIVADLEAAQKDNRGLSTSPRIVHNF